MRGHNVMKGYHNRPEATPEAMKGGWLHTGDLARVDEDGYFYIVDRKKDMIIRGGYNVYPREIEEVLYEHPAVLEAAVIGVPDAVFGEEVAASIVLRPGANASTDENARVRQGPGGGVQIPAPHLVRRRAPQRLHRQIAQARDPGTRPRSSRAPSAARGNRHEQAVTQPWHRAHPARRPNTPPSSATPGPETRRDRRSGFLTDAGPLDRRGRPTNVGSGGVRGC